MNRKDFYDTYQEIIEEELSWDGITNESVERIFYDEMNWNNGDITSGQYSLSKEDIEELLDELGEEIYPLTVVLDRYGGTYSDGKYTAWNLHSDEVPVEIHGSDVECCHFWSSTYSKLLPVGKGLTIVEAIHDLKSKATDEHGNAWYFTRR